MKEITVPTNMHCNSCVAKLAKVLDNAPGIHHWKADVKSPEKKTVTMRELGESELVALIRKAGFDVNTNIAAACDMKACVEPVQAAVAGFLTPLPYNYYQLKKHDRACH
jgi:copper chaperone CopZ